MFGVRKSTAVGSTFMSRAHGERERESSQPQVDTKAAGEQRQQSTAGAAQQGGRRCVVAWRVCCCHDSACYVRHICGLATDHLPCCGLATDARQREEWVIDDTQVCTTIIIAAAGESLHTERQSSILLPSGDNCRSSWCSEITI